MADCRAQNTIFVVEDVVGFQFGGWDADDSRWTTSGVVMVGDSAVIDRCILDGCAIVTAAFPIRGRLF